MFHIRLVYLIYRPKSGQLLNKLTNKNIVSHLFLNYTYYYSITERENDMEINTMNISRGLTYYRTQRKLEQHALADEITAIRAFQRMEKGETLPRLDTLHAISNRLAVPVNKLIFFDEYALYEKLNAHKDKLFDYYNEENTEMLQEIEDLIDALFELSPPFEMRQELTIYQLYIYSSHYRMYSEQPLNHEFYQQLDSLLSNYKINKPIFTADVALVILFFLYQPQPLEHDFYHNQITSALEQQSHTGIIYRINIELIKLEAWEKIIEFTLPHLAQLSTHAKIAPLTFIYGQLALAQYHVNDKTNAQHHHTIATTLLSMLNNPQLDKRFFDCITSQFSKKAPQ